MKYDFSYRLNDLHNLRRQSPMPKNLTRLIRVRLMRLLWLSYSQVFTYFTAKIVIYLTMTGDCGCFPLLAVHIHGVPGAFSEKLTPTILKMAD